jgi:flagellar protein FliO/FliZ
MTGVDALLRLLPSLALIVGALLLLRHWAQKGRAGSPTPMRVVSRTSVTRGSVLAVVEVGERRLLVGAAEQSVNLLAELDPAPDLAADTPVRPIAAAPAAPATDRQGLLEQLRHTTLTSTRPRPLSDERPRMAPLDRLRHLTVRTPAASHPRRPTRAAPPS